MEEALSKIFSPEAWKPSIRKINYHLRCSFKGSMNRKRRWTEQSKPDIVRGDFIPRNYIQTFSSKSHAAEMTVFFGLLDYPATPSFTWHLRFSFPLIGCLHILSNLLFSWRQICHFTDWKWWGFCFCFCFFRLGKFDLALSDLLNFIKNAKNRNCGCLCLCTWVAKPKETCW